MVLVFEAKRVAFCFSSRKRYYERASAASLVLLNNNQFENNLMTAFQLNRLVVQTFCVQKVAQIVVVCKNEDLMLAIFKVEAQYLKRFKND